MFFSKLQRLCVFSMSFFLLSTMTVLAQSEKFYSEIKKEDARGDNSSDKESMDKLDKHPNATNVHYSKMGNIAKVLNNGLFDFPSPVTGKIMHAMTMRIEYKANNDYVWYGTLSDSTIKGEMLIISEKGKVFGHLNFLDENYQIYGVGNGISAFLPAIKVKNSIIDPDQLPKPKLEPENPSKLVQGTQAVDGVCAVSNRILVIATSKAIAFDPNYVQTATVAVTQFNQSLYNTGIYVPEAILTLAGVVPAPSSFSETVDIKTDVDKLTADPNVQGLRDAYQADLVIALTATPGGYHYYQTKNCNCTFYGVVEEVEAAPNNAYGIVEDYSALGADKGYTFAHEVSHIFGAKHENDYLSTPNIPYAKGSYFEHTGLFFQHYFVTIPHTLTSQPGEKQIDPLHPEIDPITRLLQFGSPLVTYEGVTTGDASVHDVARRIRERAATVANFRSGGKLTAVIVNPSGQSSINSQGSYTFSANVSCDMPIDNYQWAFSSDGTTYYNVSTSSTANVSIYPYSTYAKGLYIRLQITDSRGASQSATVFSYIPVYNVPHYIKIGNSGIGSISSNALSGNISLSEAYPNPASETANIEFEVADKQNIKLELFNELGMSVRTLESGEYDSGRYRHTLSTQNLVGGLYYYRLTADNFSAVKRLVISK